MGEDHNVKTQTPNVQFHVPDSSPKKQSQLQQQQNATGSLFSRAAASKLDWLEEIRKNPDERDPNSDSNVRVRLLFEAAGEAFREGLRKLGSFENNNNNDSSFQQSSLNSYFSDVKASRKKPSQLQQQQNPTGLPSSRAAPSTSASVEEIRKNAAEFRQRSSVPPPLGLDLVFREISERDANSDSKPSGKLSFEAIREFKKNEIK
ncbi:hypothetical protein Patl1_15251 [Pistacia atlantica]|uniref:Uncharacterized protein n=1 Tax=Pistacia atlantica TaxID=434234 RepID=A0ACC1B740_9ROSI|nr:hypothetical protein Patl1_15251 [Pistacia atlantica]